MKNKNIVSKERKIFLNSLNCWVSNFIIEEIRTDYNPDAKIKYNFMGTLNTSDQPLPRYFEPKITKIEIGYNYNQEVFNNDILIYNLDDSNLSEVEFIIRGLKNIKYESDKILVLISNIMTWAKTPLKIRTKEEMEKEGFDEEEFFEFKEEPEIKKEEEEKKEEEINNEENNNNNNEESEVKKSRKESKIEENNNNNNNNNNENVEENTENKKEEEKIEPENIPKEPEPEPEPERPHIFYYKDSEFTERIPHKKYFQYKLLEMQALQINNPNLKVYIICPGFIYGCGEDFFFDYFRNAFLGKKINIIGEGKNSLPTIHIKDLASMLKKVIEKKFASNSNKYFFAVDHTKNPSMFNIISSISKSIGDGKINKITDFDIDEIDIPNYEEINIDLKIKTSSIFEDKRRQGEDIEDFDKRKFKWHCEFGIPENLELLRNEFNLYRNLKPIKILVLGPPSSGKSTICNFLSNKFKILSLKIDEMIEWCKNLNNPDENSEENKISTELKNKIQELEENVLIAQEEYEKRKNKKKTDPPFDPIQFKKIPNELLYKVIKLRLKNSDCLSKGYILDGFPKNYNDALELFNDIKREEIVEEEVENNIHNKKKNIVEEKKEPKIIEINLIKEIFPDSVILIDNYNEDNLKKKLILLNKDYEEKQMEYDNRFNRRLHKYKEDNETEGKKNLKDFFNENKLEIFLYDEQKNIDFPEPKPIEEQQQENNNENNNISNNKNVNNNNNNNNKNVNNNNNIENNNNNNIENNENIENENNIENEEENKEKSEEEKNIIKEPPDFNNINKYLERNGPINNIERLTDDDDIIPIGEDDINDEEDEKILNQHDLSNELEKHLNESSHINDSNIEKKISNKKSKNLEKKESNINNDININDLKKENSNIKQIIEKEEKENKTEKEEEEKINELKEREKKLLEKKSEILRRYLSENVIPLLAKGVLNICQNLPEDPVDALANFLLENTFNNAIKKNNNNADNNNINNNLANIDVEEIKKKEDDNLNLSKLTENSIVNMEKK